MSEQIIECPHCHERIPLTEALTHGIEEQLREQLFADVQKREAALQEANKRIAAEREAMRVKEQAIQEQIDAEVKKRGVDLERRASARAAEKAKEDFEVQLRELRESEAEKEAKLRKFQEEQLALRKQMRELEDKRRELELEVERKLAAERDAIRLAAAEQEGEKHRVQEMQLKKTIEDMKLQMEEMRRRAEQGSQQQQGEVRELQIEEMLRTNFVFDVIEPVGKGVRGADVVQRVRNSRGDDCGSIVWESKQTKTFSAQWIGKLKEDQRAIKGEFAVLVSSALPPDVKAFDYRDGVFLCSFEAALPLATTLRLTLEQIAMNRQAGEGKAQKMELLYAYLSGNEFRARIEAIAEAFSAMQKELAIERKAYEKIWAGREKLLQGALKNTMGLYGDIQNISGASLPEIESFGTQTLLNEAAEMNFPQAPRSAKRADDSPF